MRLWAFLMGLFFWYVLASSGYEKLGLFALFACGVYALLPEKKASGKKSKGYEELEPIVIESKRGAPYRIPDKIELSYKEKSGPDKDWADDVVSAVTGVISAGVNVVRKALEEDKK